MDQIMENLKSFNTEQLVPREYQEVYTIYDVIAKNSLPIFVADNEGVAERIYRKTLAQHSLKEEEFALVKLARFYSRIPVLESIELEDSKKNTEKAKSNRFK